MVKEMRRKVLLVGLVLMLAMVLPMCASKESEPQKTAETPSGESKLEPITIRIKSGPVGTTWYGQASALAGIIEREIPGSSVTVETGSAISNIVLVEEGKTDIGFTFAALLPAALKGEKLAGEYFQKPAENIRVLIYTTSAGYALITSADKGWEFIDDIKGKPVKYVTFPPGYVARYMSDKILEAHGITLEDIEKWGGQVIIVNKYKEAVDLLAKGQADVIAYVPATVGQSPALIELEAQKEFKILKLRDEAKEKIMSEYPVITYTLQPGLYKSIKEPTEIVVDITTYLVPKDMPEDVAYTIVKMIVEHKDELANTNAEFGQLTKEDFLLRVYGKPGQPPLHPGAEKYYREAGILS